MSGGRFPYEAIFCYNTPYMKVIYQPWIHSDATHALAAAETFNKYDCKQFAIEGVNFRDRPYTKRELIESLTNMTHPEFLSTLFNSMPEDAIIYACETTEIPSTLMYEDNDEGGKDIKLDIYRKSLLASLNEAKIKDRQIMDEREDAFVQNILFHKHNMNDDTLYIGYGIYHVKLENKLKNVFPTEMIVEPMNSSLYNEVKIKKQREGILKKSAQLTAGLLVTREVLGEKFKDKISLADMLDKLRQAGYSIQDYLYKVSEKAIELAELPDTEIVEIWNENRLR